MGTSDFTEGIGETAVPKNSARVFKVFTKYDLLWNLRKRYPK